MGNFQRVELPKEESMRGCRRIDQDSLSREHTLPRKIPFLPLLHFLLKLCTPWRDPSGFLTFTKSPKHECWPQSDIATEPHALASAGPEHTSGDAIPSLDGHESHLGSRRLQGRIGDSFFRIAGASEPPNSTRNILLLLNAGDETMGKSPTAQDDRSEGCSSWAGSWKHTHV